MSTFVLDPKGYFLIRIKDEQVELAFLEYTEEQKQGKFSDNEVKERFSSKNYDELINWCKKRITRKDHSEYLERELKKALVCLEKGEKYVQP